MTANLEEKTAYSMRVLSAAITFWRERGVPVVVTGVPHYLQYEGSWSTRPHAVLARTTTEAGNRIWAEAQLAFLRRGDLLGRAGAPTVF